jgi:sulfite reductase alpha subunit-like flavoprotein
VFDLNASGMTYKTAGNLAIYPENSDPIVNKFAELAGLNLN